MQSKRAATVTHGTVEHKFGCRTNRDVFYFDLSVVTYFLNIVYRYVITFLVLLLFLLVDPSTSLVVLTSIGKFYMI